MFKRTCSYCHVTIEAPFDELGLKVDEERIEINKKRKADKKPMEKYEKELEDYYKQIDKDSRKVFDFNEKNKLDNSIYKMSPKVINNFDGGYSVSVLKTEVVDEVVHYAPKEPQINLLSTLYIECKICGHKYYLDGSNEYGF